MKQTILMKKASGKLWGQSRGVIWILQQKQRGFAVHDDHPRLCMNVLLKYCGGTTGLSP